MRWDTGRRWWRRGRCPADSTIVAANGPAMLVRVALRVDLHVGSRVDVHLASGRGVVEIRHITPTGDADGVALVGVEFVATDESLGAHLARQAVDPLNTDADRWWWQRRREVE